MIYKNDALRLRILFHNTAKDSKILEKRISESQGGDCVLIVTTNPKNLQNIFPNLRNENENLQIHETELYIFFTLFAGDIGSANELFIRIRNAIKEAETRYHRTPLLDIDIQCADPIQAFTAARLSAIYDSHVHLGDDERKIQSLPGNVELNDREKDLLLFYFDNKQLFSKTEVLEHFEEFNSNKYQASKDKLEKNGLIMHTLPPVDREIRSGKNPDYFKVTVNGLYSALLDKEYNEQIDEKDQFTYYIFTKMDNLKIKDYKTNDAKKFTPIYYKMDLSRDPYNNFD